MKETINTSLEKKASIIWSGQCLIADNNRTLDTVTVNGFLTKEQTEDVLNWAQNKELFSSDSTGHRCNYTSLGLGIQAWAEKDFDWLYFKLLQCVDEINDMAFHADLFGLVEPLQLVKYTDGDFRNWNKDWGYSEKAIIANRRKLSIHILLNKECSGGEFEYFSEKKHVIEHGAGSLIVHPSWLQYRIKPVEKGEMYYLHGWLSGSTWK